MYFRNKVHHHFLYLLFIFRTRRDAIPSACRKPMPRDQKRHPFSAPPPISDGKFADNSPSAFPHFCVLLPTIGSSCRGVSMPGRRTDHENELGDCFGRERWVWHSRSRRSSPDLSNRWSQNERQPLAADGSIRILVVVRAARTIAE